MVDRNFELNALAWKAKTEGKSYGSLSMSLSKEDKEQIIQEYAQIIENRQIEETERLIRAKKAKLVHAKKSIGSHLKNAAK